MPTVRRNISCGTSMTKATVPSASELSIPLRVPPTGSITTSVKISRETLLPYITVTTTAIIPILHLWLPPTPMTLGELPPVFTMQAGTRYLHPRIAQRRSTPSVTAGIAMIGILGCIIWKAGIMIRRLDGL